MIYFSSSYFSFVLLISFFFYKHKTDFEKKNNLLFLFAGPQNGRFGPLQNYLLHSLIVIHSDFFVHSVRIIKKMFDKFLLNRVVYKKP